LDEWVYLFKNSKVEDDFTAKGMNKAKEKLAIAKLPKRKRLEYERYLKSLHDEASWNETQRIKAMMEEKREREFQETMQKLKQATKQAEQAEQAAKQRAEQAEQAAQQRTEQAEQAAKQRTEQAEQAAQQRTEQAEQAAQQRTEQAEQAAQQRTEQAERVLSETQKKAVIKALQRGKLSLEEIADDNEVSIEFVLRIQKELKK
jgi:hypothetical protein